MDSPQTANNQNEQIQSLDSKIAEIKAWHWPVKRDLAIQLMMWAAEQNRANIIDRLCQEKLITKFEIDESKRISLEHDEGHTALLRAVTRENIEAVEALLQNGANPNRGSDMFGHPPLFFAYIALRHKKEDGEDASKIEKIIGMLKKSPQFDPNYKGYFGISWTETKNAAAPHHPEDKSGIPSGEKLTP